MPGIRIDSNSFQRYSISRNTAAQTCPHQKTLKTSPLSSEQMQETKNLDWGMEVWAAYQLWDKVRFTVTNEGMHLPAMILGKEFRAKEFRAKEEVERAFEGLGDIECRVKSQKSIYSKLFSKAVKNNHETISLPQCRELIGDAIGTRLVLKELDSETIENIKKDALKKANLSPKLYDKWFKGELSKEEMSNENVLEALDIASGRIVTRLSETQTQGFVDALNKAIKNHDLKLVELNNYAGLGGYPYLSKRQVQSIADTHFEKYQENLIVNSAADDIHKSGNKGIKASGYTTLQMNVIHRNGALGELQIRGPEITKFAEYEHVPYDIRKGKLFSDKAKYEEITPTLENLSEESYAMYNNYLTECYKYMRLQELGIGPGKAPTFPTALIQKANLSEREAYLLSQEGLSELSKT